ncbi:TPA: endolytic transglycosylase MltG [Candidatus Saccharibacteria bacterium]|nr:endolytic transglycosylase MltG [Candidatus Saccharibacteria bacterium]|tara:strand:- start:1522 stop:2748 length:1227 start_codon:yes stop_codon:yes gene_type:complete
MDEFRRRPVNKLTPPTTPPSSQLPTVPPQKSPVPSPPAEPILETPAGVSPPPKKRSWVKITIIALAGLVGLGVVALAGLFWWYTAQLAPVNPDATEELVVVEVVSGSSPSQIAQTLEESGVIRSQTAFLWYTRFERVQNALQAGTYRLSPSESTQEITTHLVNGRVDTFSITFFPGATLTNTTDTPESQKLDVTSVLLRAGYSEEEVARGIAAQYPAFADTLFQGRPTDADLEGYVYGETYQFPSNATVEDILTGTFTEFWAVIQENNLVAAFEAQGLTLYEGITLASIVQRESGGDDKEEIAQVFYSRYRSGMVLGSDVTYQYITDKLGVERDINFDSEYNTRRYPGLPPGPIATPGYAALLATAHPADTEYLYFLSGDDDVTYFARTLEEHEANIVQHCQVKCQII